MDIPFFSGDGMSGTSRRHITNYGTSKYDMEEVSRHFCREPIGLCRWEHTNTKSHSWWHSGEGNYKDSRDPSDAKMAWEGKSSYEKSLKKSYRYALSFQYDTRTPSPICIFLFFPVLMILSVIPFEWNIGQQEYST